MEEAAKRNNHIISVSNLANIVEIFFDALTVIRGNLWDLDNVEGSAASPLNKAHISKFPIQNEVPQFCMSSLDWQTAFHDSTALFTPSCAACDIVSSQRFLPCKVSSRFPKCRSGAPHCLKRVSQSKAHIINLAWTWQSWTAKKRRLSSKLRIINNSCLSSKGTAAKFLPPHGTRTSIFGASCRSDVSQGAICSGSETVLNAEYWLLTC